MDDVDRLRAELAELTEEVGFLRARLDALTAREEGSGSVESMTVDAWAGDCAQLSGRVGRRGVLKAAAGAAVGTAVGATALARPAVATDGQPVQLGMRQNTNRGLVIEAGNLQEGGKNPLAAGHAVFIVEARFAPVKQLIAIEGVVGGSDPGVSGRNSSGDPALSGAGVRGRSIHREGVAGESEHGVGLRGSSTASVGVQAQGPVALWLQSTDPAPPPARADLQSLDGMVTPDGNHDLWSCVGAGTPGTWRKLAGPGTAGAYHPIDPQRVYDSRHGDGPLSPNTSRTVSVANGLSSSGAVVAADVVPVGATAVTFNVTVSSPNGPNFLSVVPGGSASFTTSTINFPGGFDCANGSAVRLGNDRQITIFCGDQTGATHAIVDITGYYL